MKVYVENIFEEEEKNGYHELTKELLNECKERANSFPDYLYICSIEISWDSKRNCPCLFLSKYEIYC